MRGTMSDMGMVWLTPLGKQPPIPPTSCRGSLQPEIQQSPSWKGNAVKGKRNRLDQPRPAVRRPGPQTLRVQRQVTQFG